VDYERSRITVISKQMNVPMEATFKKFTVKIAFDPKEPAAGEVRVDIDVGSFDIGQRDFNDEARTRDWFDVQAFPSAKFVSSGIRAVGSGRFEARGPLTIKGRTHEVVVPFSVGTDRVARIYEGTVAIHRLEYEIGEGVWKDTDTIADKVQIKFRIVVAGVPANS